MIFRVLDPITVHKSSRREPVAESTAVYVSGKRMYLIGMTMLVMINLQLSPTPTPPRVPEPQIVFLAKTTYREK